MKCGAIKPMHPDYEIDPSLFQWSLDGQAMSRLRSIKPLVAVAQSVSARVGKPWIEANFNGIRLSHRQMPQIYAMAVHAARILGLKRMPGVYVSGARPWDALTFGSDTDSFIVMGSALVSCFQKSELMFLFAREMGHILAGHALWKTVIQFLVGEQSSMGGMMRNGITGLLDPTRLLEGAIELPLIAWARQAEITADRAGLLVSGGLEQARKSLITWSLKSPVLYPQINIKAWIEQQEMDTADSNIRLAEAVSTATPYLSRRLQLMQEYDASLIVQQFRKHLMTLVQPLPRKAPQQPGPASTPVPSAKPLPAPEPNSQAENKRQRTFTCPACKKPILFAPTSAGNQRQIAIRCPNASCQQISVLTGKREESPGNQRQGAQESSTPGENPLLASLPS
jgi:Zn-dependent protease with chaperone function